MPENPPRLSPQRKTRSWVFYAIATFGLVVLVAGAIYLAITFFGRNRIHAARPGAKPSMGAAFKPASFDGIGWKIEAEDYDLGGEGVAYHDAFPGNILYEFNPEQKRPGEYRNDDVEIMSKNPGQLNVGFVLEGEWLAYTVDIPQTGMYALELNVAAMHPGRRIHFELDGQRLPETVTLPVTGDWARFQVVTMLGDIHLTKGRHQLKLVFDESFMNVDWLRLTPRGTGGSRSP